MMAWPGEEKHLHLAQLQQDGGQPAGEVQAALLPVFQPPVAAALPSASYLLIIELN